MAFTANWFMQGSLPAQKDLGNLSPPDTKCQKKR